MTGDAPLEIGWPADLTLYKLLRDWGSAIGGLLALFAGFIAFAGVWFSAKKQVNSTNQQTSVLRQQNTEFKTEARRNFARNALTSITLIESVLRGIQDDIVHVNQLVNQPQFENPALSVPATWRQLIHKPSLAIVWNNLGWCGTEVIRNYLSLDYKLEEFAKTDITAAQVMQNNLREFEKIVKLLREELEKAARRCNDVLLETSQQ